MKETKMSNKNYGTHQSDRKTLSAYSNKKNKAKYNQTCLSYPEDITPLIQVTSSVINEEEEKPLGKMVKDFLLQQPTHWIFF